MRFGFLAMGILFGFLLSRAGATTYDFYAQLFLFENLQLMWVIAAAASVGAIGKYLLKRSEWQAVTNKEKLSFEGKPYTKSLIPGSLIMGAGWGLAGACPGTVLAMLGEGKLGAMFTIAGIAFGTFLFGVQQYRTKRTQVTV